MRLRALLAVGAIALFAACETPYQATDNGTSTVVRAPDGVQYAFTTQYPGAANVVWATYDANAVPIDWELSKWAPLGDDDYLVRFDLDDNNYYAWYDETGTWIGSTYMIRDLSTVPIAVSTAAKNKYPGYMISSVSREIEKNGMLYEVEMKGTENKVKMLVDENGNIVRHKERPLN